MSPLPSYSLMLFGWVICNLALENLEMTLALLKLALFKVLRTDHRSQMSQLLHFKMLVESCLSNGRCIEPHFSHVTDISEVNKPRISPPQWHAKTTFVRRVSFVSLNLTLVLQTNILFDKCYSIAGAVKLSDTKDRCTQDISYPRLSWVRCLRTITKLVP